MKRLKVFFLSNLVLVLLLSFSICSLWPFFNGLNFYPFALFCAVMYLGTAFLAFAISKHKAQQLLVAKPLKTPSNTAESWLLATVEKQSKLAGIRGPAVAIYDSVDINAFASGLSRHHALIAVSSGLLWRLPRYEAEAVLAHEVSHIANADMTKLIAMQGIANILVVLLACFMANQYAISHFYGWAEVAMFVAVLAMGLVLAALAVMWFLRRIEFLADVSGARISGNAAMIAALEFLDGAPSSEQPQVALGIAGSIGVGMKHLFMSHPLLSERILALKLRH
ncbi:M48 family metalloprotease [Iodobacter fluviatilis]|uniref:Zinc metalloprotease HtpX n=1 Tax=Iodobacter fluviatilis TaxID=537 RepID=A0A7G3GCH3_9NEIS|nr:M48 family metalloprotease [Iodobacter fluviatilis]QBC44623.1 zinc metalloprotease HtpX [Iodobacter fluviatilis]